MENWKLIIGYEKLYEISNLGRVRSIIKNIILKPGLQKTGYLSINVSNKSRKKTYFIHRLVAIHFISNPENKREVNHKDFNKTNNTKSNLEWVTGKENVIHAIQNSNYNKKRTQEKAVCHSEKKAFGPENLCINCYHHNYWKTYNRKR